MCPICTEVIEEAAGRKKGHDSIYCDGACQNWIHRQCAGLSKAHFSRLSTSDQPFHCPRCLLSHQSAELRALKKTVEDLSREVLHLKHLILPSTNCGNPPPKPSFPSDRPSQKLQSASSIPSQPSSLPSQQSRSPATYAPVDRKFNIIIFGIPEQPQGSSRFMRSQNDFNAISTTISKVENDSNHKSSIRDCHRIGKYQSSRSRPILVSLNSTADVRNILSINRSLSSSVSIKPDRSPAERKTESVLLKERWRLIQTGTDRHSIRLRGSALYVNGRLHGRATDSVFTLTPTLDDLAPHLRALSNNSTPCLPPTSESVSSPVSEAVSPTSSGAPPLVPPPALASNSSPTSTVSSPAPLSNPVHTSTVLSSK